MKRCNKCKRLYDETKRKIAHDCPYCAGDNNLIPPRGESGFTDEAIYEHLLHSGYGEIMAIGNGESKKDDSNETGQV